LPGTDSGRNDVAFEICNEAEKRITAQAIRVANADILVLQELESLELLDRFSSQYLASMGTSTGCWWTASGSGCT